MLCGTCGKSITTQYMMEDGIPVHGSCTKPPVRIRARVIEHRVTRHCLEFIIRWWIESDPAFGGISAKQAFVAAEAAEGVLTLGDSALQDFTPAALRLLDACPAANSVEVCSSTGHGVAVHRDWP